jgi:hypothetical protein
MINPPPTGTFRDDDGTLRGTICIDFDGVIHSYERGWADGTIYGEPVDGALEALQTLQGRYARVIFTSRDVDQVKKWMWERMQLACATDHFNLQFWNEPDLILVTNRKLPALAYIDDRGIRFIDWFQAIADLSRLLNPVDMPAHIYRRKPTAVCAIRYTGDNLNEIWGLFGSAGIYGPTETNPDHLLLTTIDDKQVPCPVGHWVIAEPVPDRFYPCDPGVFADRHELPDGSAIS